MVNKRNISNIILFVITLVVFLALTGSQPVSAEQNVVNVYIFEGEGCPYCAKALAYLNSLAESDPRIVIHDFEVYHNLENRAYFIDFAAKHGYEPQYVPNTFIGDRYWIGFSDTIQAEMEQYIQGCLSRPCVDYGKEILPDSYFAGLETPPEIETPDESPDPSTDRQFSLTVPLLGTINLADQSLFLSTLLISFVDGFNPCSIWVLSMLLAITLNARSRKKVLIIGFVFIFVTAFIYALFIGGLFTVFTFIGYVGWIQVIVALVALVFALINIKDYFWYKEGISLTISDKKKPGIYKGIRRIMNAQENLWGLVTATVVLAAGVSLVEFSCTAGFPMIWTNLLAVQEVSGLAFLGLLLVYLLVYQVDEMGIFLVAMFTLRKSKMEEKYGRILKLLGGTLMLSLAVVMLVDPSLMNNIGSSLWVFGAAFVVTALVLLLHRVILPKFNIRLGSEK
ncbi:MAG: glutaredoxin [Brevefilum sp.]|nr:glutaredoxin [Brevefilum sp.]